MTKYPDIFAALAAPFADEEVKQREAGKDKQGNKIYVDYITARTVMNRLDSVLGPENWFDDYESHENSVVCRLTIVLPDGQRLTKGDAGGYAGMADSGDDSKSGYSDSFKRAAVKFGIARVLYRDGVPDFVQERTGLKGPASPLKQPPLPSTGQPPSSPPRPPLPTTPAKPKDNRSYWQLVMDATQRRNAAHKTDIGAAETHWMLCVLAAEQGLCTLPTADVTNASLKIMEGVYAANSVFVIRNLTSFFQGKITPHPIDHLFTYERQEDGVFPAGLSLQQFVEAEITEQGRGKADEVMTLVKTSRLSWDKNDERNKIVEMIRGYIENHWCSLSPLTLEGAVV